MLEYIALILIAAGILGLLSISFFASGLGGLLLAGVIFMLARAYRARGS